MWSVINKNSDNDINYLVDDRFQGTIASPTNLIWVLELTFIPENTNQNKEITPFSYYVGIFKDAKRVLTEEEIIDEIHRFKTPFARLINKNKYKIF